MNIKKRSLGSFDVTDDILEQLKVQRAIAERRYQEISDYVHLLAVSESGRFENVALRRQEKELSGDNDKTYDIGELILLNDGFLFLPYARMKTSSATFSPWLLFGAVGGAVYGYQRHKEKKQDEAVASNTSQEAQVRKEALNHLSTATQYAIVVDSIWFRASDIDETMFEHEKGDDQQQRAVSGEAARYVIKMHAKTSKKGVNEQWEFQIPVTAQDEAWRCLDTWDRDVAVLRQEKADELNQVADSLRKATRTPDRRALIELSRHVELICKDKEKLEMLTKALLSASATTSSRMGIRLIAADLSMLPEKHLLFRKTVFERASNTIGGLQKSTGRYSAVIAELIGLLLFIGILYSPDSFSLFNPVSLLMIKLRPAILAVGTPLLLCGLIPWVYSMVLKSRLNKTARRYGLQKGR